jgi:hypothetical protein
MRNQLSIASKGQLAGKDPIYSQLELALENTGTREGPTVVWNTFPWYFLRQLSTCRSVYIP